MAAPNGLVNLDALAVIFRQHAETTGERTVFVTDTLPADHTLRLMETLGVDVEVRAPVTAVAVNQDVTVREGTNGELVVMSARCGRCDRVVMPTPDGRCSWCQSVIVDEDRLSSKAMRAQLAAAPAPPAEIVQSTGRDRPNSREAILDAFRRFRTEHGRWPLPGDAADYSYLPYRPSSARHGAVGRHFAGWQGIWTALDAGHIPTGRAAWKYKLTGTLRPAALPEREPKGRETPVLSGASPAADPGVGSTAAAVVNDSPEQLLGGAELGSRSESADALRALVAAARVFLDTLEKEIP